MQNIISLIGMSGVGKTRYASLQDPSQYFHYSVDYVIGQYLLKDEIVSNLLKNLKNGFFNGFVRENKVSINANIKARDLSLVSDFLGKFGSKELGGLQRKEFLYRQKLYADAEKEATLYLMQIADKIFSLGYKYILNDLTGSICEIVDFDDPQDEILSFLKQTTIHYIEASKSQIDLIIRRSQESPKPLLYNEEFFNSNVEAFLREKNIKSEAEINPDEFCKYTFPRLIAARVEKYERLVRNA